MTAPAAPPASAVTVLVTRRAHPEHLPEFERGLETLMAAGRQFDGYLGGQVVRPQAGDGSEPGLYNLIFAFRDEASLTRWQQSAERAACLRALSPHVLAQTGHRRVPGLELWFSPPGASRPPPPRWKVAVVTWCGICPTVWGLQTLLGPPLATLPSLARVALITLAVVGLMTWVVAPRLTRLFSGWLYAAR